ncbi:YARHG domain-containing protein [Flavobacterium aquicola]|uniref:YARHG domain-containing protein n=1 Tax=Flavobacterium aquicola TaxID=1682742 RepID=A0A3E0E3W5_9FLAO|nr:YARHG domain-containing protein [Flavobacterium aquicola]REG92984.1 YARHG domain-containing protein [Flavobacterium aquicola]
MRKILIVLFVTTLVSCKKEKLENSEKIEIVNNSYNDLYGNWVGDIVASVHDTTNDFVYSNKINIVIKRIEKNRVFGQSIVAGNSRPLSGELKKTANGYEFTLKELGNSKYDGRFEFSIENKILKGTWFSNDKKQHVTQRTFELKKQEFKYNPNAMLPNYEDEPYVDYYSVKIDTVKTQPTDSTEVEETYFEETYRSASDVVTKINSSTAKLTEKDLKNLKKLELEILRNTIYARHGYSFKKKNYRQFFDAVDWYIPVSENVDNELTSLEKNNINLLERFEKYAEDNYDSFGR